MNDRYKEVPPIGPENADIAIVGEAPGSEEVSQMEPFVGSAGKLLNQILRMTGIPRSTCYLTNVAKARPRGNNFKHRYYKKGQPTSELRRYITDLQKELEKVNPNVVVALGNEPLKALTGYEGITKYRGSILSANIGKVIPTLHPAATLRYWAHFPYMLMDFNRVKKESKTPEINMEEYDLITNPSLIEAKKYLKELTSEPVVAFDIEAVGKNIDMVSFCGDTSWSICIPFMETSGGNVKTTHYWSHHDERVITRLIDNILSDKTIGKVAQNANFDIAFMEKYGYTINNLYLDTMNAQHSVYPELKKGLDTIQSIYTKIPYHKDRISENRQVYNALDSLATRRAVEGLESELEEFGTYEFYHEYVKKLVRYYRDLSSTGIKVDKERQQELEDVYSQKEEEIQEKINENCPWELDSNYEGVKLNPRSPTQLKEYFYELRDYYKYRKNGKLTTNEEALKRLKRKYPNDPIPGLVLEARGVRKTLGNYVRIKTDPDDRVRTTIKVSGTVTGRTACSKSINGTGTNLQNIEKGEVRSMFVPSHEDWVMTEGDYSGADAMVVAYLSEDPGLIELFNDPEQDYHANNTYLFFDECEVENPDKIGKYDVAPKLRQKSKAISHGSNYGRSARAISLDLGEPVKVTERKQNKYFNTYPGIKMWHRRVKRKLKEDGILETPFGRKRHFFKAYRAGKMSPHVLFEALSYVPQSTVGDLTHTGFMNLYETLQDQPDFPMKILLTIHDSILVEHHKDVTEEVYEMMEKDMTVPFELRGRECVIPVDFETADNWQEV